MRTEPLSLDIAVRRRAYAAVVSAWEWLNSRASDGNYWDEYTRRLAGEDASPSPMAIAETLMCLLNTREPKYQQLGLPQAEARIIEKVTEDLLKAQAHGPFSGFPYLRYPSTDFYPPFTDAVCYLVGAMVKILAYQDLVPNRRQECLELFRTGVSWLNAARIEIPREDAASSEARSFAWAWSSRGEKTLDPYQRFLTPQTYFTTQTMITLCEALFDGFDHLDEAQRANTIRSVAGGKRFLLDSATEYAVHTTRLSGWHDFDVASARRANGSAMKPYWTCESGASPMIREHSLYGLEALSYVDYYERESAYQRVRAALKRTDGESFEAFRSFSEADRIALGKIFSSSASLLLEDAMYSFPCRMQLPEPFNLPSKGDGFLRTKGASQGKSFYDDGCVMYNLLNAGHFYLMSAELLPVNEMAVSEWKTGELNFVETILRKAFNGDAFTHAQVFPDPPSVIYATRTAVASLLSWGVSAPELAEAVPLRVTRLIAELHEAVFPKRIGEPDSAISTQSDSFEARTVERLLFAGYVIGIVASRLRGQKDIKALTEYFGTSLSGQWDPDIALRSNGRRFLRDISLLVSAGEGGRQAFERLMDAPHLCEPYREIVRSLAAVGSDPAPGGRIAQMLAKFESLSQRPPKDLKSIMEELIRD